MNNNSSQSANLYATIIDNADRFLFSVFEPLSRDFQTTAGVIFMLYLIFSLLALIKFGNGEMAAKIVMSLLVFAIVFEFVFTEGSQGFRDWFYLPIINTSQDLTTFFIDPSSPSKGMLSIIKGFEDRVLNLSYAVSTSQSTSDVGILDVISPLSFMMSNFFSDMTSNIMDNIVWFLLLIGYVFIAGAFVVYTLIGILGMHILFLASPVTIMMAGIPATRHIFNSWIKAVITFALIAPFCGAVMGLLNFKLDSVVADITKIKAAANPYSAETVIIFILYFLTILLLRKAPEFASAITGGVMTGVTGAAGAIGGAAASYSMFSRTSKASGLGKMGTEGAGNLVGNIMKNRLK